MKITKISSKGQITLSKYEMSLLGANLNDIIIKDSEEGVITLIPLKTSIVMQTAGKLANYIDPAKKGKAFSEILKQTKIITSKKLATR